MKKLNKPISYYLLLPGEPEEHVEYESNLLGESDIMGTFWAGSALKTLMQMGSENSEILNNLIIKTDQNKSLTIEQFLNTIQKFKIKYDNL